MRTANPALNSKTFTGFGQITDTSRAMSIQGTVNKIALLALLVLITSSWTWRLYYTSGNPAAVMPWVLGGAFGGFIVALITIFKNSGQPFQRRSMLSWKACFLVEFLPFLKPNILVLSFKR